MASKVHATRLRELFLNSIRALTEALEAKDPYTAGHSRRVTEICVAIAVEMNLPRNDLSQVRLAAVLHDLGKIGVRESVLNKPDKLTDEEYEHVMQHVEIGRRILEPVLHGSAVLEMVAHHHEKFDGTGRPEGLRGNNIPVGARIIALADAVDAMGSIRPYRANLLRDDILQEIRRNSGKQFDPKVVEAFLRTAHAQELLSGDEGLPPARVKSVEPDAAGDGTDVTEIPRIDKKRRRAG